MVNFFSFSLLVYVLNQLLFDWIIYGYVTPFSWTLLGINCMLVITGLNQIIEKCLEHKTSKHQDCKIQKSQDKNEAAAPKQKNCCMRFLGSIYSCVQFLRRKICCCGCCSKKKLETNVVEDIDEVSDIASGIPYEDARLDFALEYDRANPITALKATREWVDFYQSKKEQAMHTEKIFPKAIKEFLMKCIPNMIANHKTIAENEAQKSTQDVRRRSFDQNYCVGDFEILAQKEKERIRLIHQLSQSAYYSLNISDASICCGSTVRLNPDESEEEFDINEEDVFANICVYANDEHNFNRIAPYNNMNFNDSENPDEE